MCSQVKDYCGYWVSKIGKLDLAVELECEIGGITFPADLDVFVDFFLAVFAQFINDSVLMNFQDVNTDLMQLSTWEFELLCWKALLRKVVSTIWLFLALAFLQEKAKGRWIWTWALGCRWFWSSWTRKWSPKRKTFSFWYLPWWWVLWVWDRKIEGFLFDQPRSWFLQFWACFWWRFWQHLVDR